MNGGMVLDGREQLALLLGLIISLGVYIAIRRFRPWPEAWNPAVVALGAILMGVTLFALGEKTLAGSLVNGLGLGLIVGEWGRPRWGRMVERWNRWKNKGRKLSSSKEEKSPKRSRRKR